MQIEGCRDAVNGENSIFCKTAGRHNTGWALITFCGMHLESLYLNSPILAIQRP